MKLIKILFKLILFAVVLAVAAVLALPLWFGPVVKLVANAAVPCVVKTDFHLGHLSLNPYTARFELGDLRLSNPTGYPEKYAVTLGTLAFDAKTASLMTDVIHIEEIAVKDVFVSYVSGGAEKINNFQQLQYNAAGGKAKYESAKVAKELLTADHVERRDGSKAQAQEKEKKFVIDRLEVAGVVVQMGVVPIRVPSMSMTDIGKKSDGATLEELWQQVVEAAMKSAGVVGDQLKVLEGALGDMSGSASKAAFETTATVTDAASKTTSAVTDTAAQTGKAVGDTATKAAESVGKSLNALKKLW